MYIVYTVRERCNNNNYSKSVSFASHLRDISIRTPRAVGSSGSCVTRVMV